MPMRKPAFRSLLWEEKQISVHTVRQYIKNLLAKNGYRKQTELVAMLVRALG